MFAESYIDELTRLNSIESKVAGSTAATAELLHCLWVCSVMTKLAIST